MKLTYEQNRICTGALCTIMGVPFVRINKKPITSDEMNALQLLFDKLIDCRERSSGASAAISDAFLINKEDLDRLLSALEDCYQEFNGDRTDLSIHLNARSEDEVSNLINTLRKTVP